MLTKKYRKGKIKAHNPEAKALEKPEFKPKVVPNKKRKQINKGFDDDRS